jgi:predicted translation initiation factor SUI1
MPTPKTLRSLAELSELLPDSRKHLPTQQVIPGAAPNDGKGNSVRVLLDKKGRRGKTVTVVSGLRHNPETLGNIARILKQHCGAGGTVKDGAIEIQGNNLIRITEKLRAMNYVVSQRESSV